MLLMWVELISFHNYAVNNKLLVGFMFGFIKVGMVPPVLQMRKLRDQLGHDVMDFLRSSS